MNNYTLDDLARRYAQSVSRRDFLRFVVGAAVVGAMRAAGARLPGVRAGVAAEDETYRNFLPVIVSPGDACSQASMCPEKVACSDDGTCICIESAEGMLHCGQIPACASPRCQVSGDCVLMGTGSFCDVPFSGCCRNPPNNLQRCVPPCGSDCPPRRDCPDRCCNISEACIGGACQRCALDKICGDTCCPEGEWCVDGQCVADSTGCPECGTCYRCFSNGLCYRGSCPAGCVEGALCRLATRSADYRKLETYLPAHGFVKTGETLAISLIVARVNRYVRDMLATEYENATSGEKAWLYYFLEATGEVGTYAIVLPSSGPVYGLAVGPASGQVVRVDAPAVATNPSPRRGGALHGDAFLAPAAPMGDNFDSHLFSSTGKCTQCNYFCTAATSVGCAAFGLLCGASVACAVAVGVFGGAACSTVMPCDEYCNSMLAPALETDVENCGACGNLCDSPNDQCCNGQCSDSLSDAMNCGGCGKSCAAGQICCQGRCESPEECCPYPLKACDGECCDFPICAPEGGCCPSLRQCDLDCCAVGKSCMTKPDGSKFCCNATQACPEEGKFGAATRCCPDGTRCVIGLGGATCR